MVNVYEVNSKRQIRSISGTFVPYLLIVIGSFILKYKLLSIGFVFVYGFLFLIDTLPTLVVHIQYYRRNRHLKLVIDTGRRELSYSDDGADQTRSDDAAGQTRAFASISNLIYYRCYAKGSGWHSFSGYRYYTIVFDDASELVVTCLMADNVEDLETTLRIKADGRKKIVCFI